MTVDQFCSISKLCPNHVKLDVDGNEFEILEGMQHVLVNKQLRSVLVEIDPQLTKHPLIPKIMKQFGFSYDPVQVEQCTVTSAKYKGMANWIFRR